MPRIPEGEAPGALPPDHPVQQAARMTNRQLAQRLRVIAFRPRSYTREERDALLEAAARRLEWPTDYAKDRPGVAFRRTT